MKKNQICNAALFFERIPEERRQNIPSWERYQQNPFAPLTLSVEEVNELLIEAGYTEASAHCKLPYPDAKCVDVVVDMVQWDGLFRYSTASGPLPSFQPAKTVSFNGRAKEMFMTIARHILQPVLEMPLYLSVPHSDPVDLPSDTDGFHIFIWSIPRNDCRAQDALPPETIFGIPVRCRDEAFRPQKRLLFRGFDVAYITDGDYYVAGLYNKRALYIYHDVVQVGAPEEFQLFAEILVRTLKILGKEPEQSTWAKDIRRRLEAKRLRKAVQAYVAQVREQGTRQVQELESEVRRLSAELTAAALALRQARDSLFNSEEAAIELFLNQIKQLEAFEKVRSVDYEVHESRLVIRVVTQPIVMHNRENRRKYLLGSLEIRITPIMHSTIGADEVANLIRIRNLDRQVHHDGSVFEAPHVKKGSTPCFGNITKDIVIHLGSWNFTALVSLLIAFFESGVDPSDQWGSAIEQFPRA